MMMGRKYWTLVAVLCVCAFVGAGCKRKSSKNSTITRNDDDIFTTDSFPGADVQSGNVADDLRAFSPSGFDVNVGSLRVVFNGDRGTAIATYKVTGTGALWAHYYNGETWTPPVSLGAIDCVTNSAVAGSVVVAFLNTEDHLSDFAQERNGDALVFWQATDVDVDPTAADDPNLCVYVTYFDVTNVESIANRYGFQEFAARLNSQDETGEDVLTIGLVSDGLCGEARWGFLGNSYSWGDSTTGITLFWQQRENNTGVLGSGFQDRALYTRFFDLAQATGADLPLVASAESRTTIATYGASDAGTSSEESQVDIQFISYNQMLFARVANENNTVGDDNPTVDLVEAGYVWPAPISLGGPFAVTLEGFSFSLTTGTASTPATLNGNAPSALDLVLADSADFLREDGNFFSNNSVYGSDEGLAALVIVFVEALDFTDPDFTDITDNARLGIAEFIESTGVRSHAFLDAEDPLTLDIVDNKSVDTRISRNGDYIAIAWLEVTAGTTADVALKVGQYMTTRIDEDGTFPVPAALASTVSAPVTVNADIDTFGVQWFTFQDQLGYVCGAQSDPDVMNLFFQHSTAGNDQIFLARVTFDQFIAPTLPVVTAPFVLESFFDGEKPGNGFVNNEHAGFNATDSGEGGNIFSVYTEDVDATANTDFRLFAEKTGFGGGRVEIDSAVIFRQVVTNQNLTLVATPPGTDIGQFDDIDLNDSDARPHGNEFIHVLFAENESHENAGLGFALRTREFNTSDASLTFGDNFRPNAGSVFELPFDLDLPGIDPNTAQDVANVTALVNGNTVGLFFTEVSHVYYQEANPGGNNGDGDVSWFTADGVSNPSLVDDDNDEEVQSFLGVGTRSCTCDSLSGAMVFWTKEFGSGSGGGLSERLQVRVREDGGSSN